ncbi:MAG: chaperonin GroEL, partial [Candidatus Binatota bacterium]|nr:chaperonin GroEL [Candidatus Binatota bacterium]
PVSTKDGVTVAKEIDLSDRFENMGVQLVKQAAGHVSDAAGDGTTTTTVLARAIFAEGMKLVAAGHDPMSLKRGIERTVTMALAELERISRPIRGTKDIAAVASIASNADPEIGDIVARALEKVGLEGLISVEDGRGLQSELRFTAGLEFDRGWLSEQFVTNPAQMEATLDDCVVFVSEDKVSSLDDILPILSIVKKARKPILVLADEVEGIALQTLVTNKVRGGMPCVAVKGPEFGHPRKEMLRDIATIVGARVVSKETGVSAKSLEVEDLGRARQVIVERARTMIIDGGGDKKDIDARLSHVRTLVRKATNDLEKGKLEDRLATLLCGVAVVKVGGVTEIDLTEKKARYDDAICATRAAIEEGIVPGGGVALLRLLDAIEGKELSEEERPAVGILRRALQEPARCIALNSGADPSVVLDRIRAGKNGFGYNAATDVFEDLIKAGVVDPTKVVRITLQTAASIAGLLLTTEATIVDWPEAVVEKDYLDPPIPDRKNFRPRAGRLK